MSEVTQPPFGARARAFASRTGVVREYGIVVATLVLAAFFSLLKPEFLTIDNLTAILSSVALVGIMAVCSTFVILTGGIDLSVGATMTLSGLAASYVLTGSGLSIVPRWGSDCSSARAPVSRAESWWASSTSRRSS